MNTYCDTCGKAISSTQPFCHHCGTKNEYKIPNSHIDKDAPIQEKQEVPGLQSPGKVRSLKNKAIIFGASIIVIVVGIVLALNIINNINNTKIENYKNDYTNKVLEIAKADGLNDATVDVEYETLYTSTPFYKVDITSDVFSGLSREQQYRFFDDMVKIINYRSIRCWPNLLWSGSDEYYLNGYCQSYDSGFIITKNETPYPKIEPTPTPRLTIQQYLSSQNWDTTGSNTAKNMVAAAALLDEYSSTEINSVANSATMDELYKDTWSYVGKVVCCETSIASIYSHAPGEDVISTKVADGESYTDIVCVPRDFDLTTSLHVFALKTTMSGFNKDDNVTVTGVVVGTDSWQNAAGATITGVTIVTKGGLVFRK